MAARARGVHGTGMINTAALHACLSVCVRDRFCLSCSVVNMFSSRSVILRIVNSLCYKPDISVACVLESVLCTNICINCWLDEVLVGLKFVTVFSLGLSLICLIVSCALFSFCVSTTTV